MHEKDENNQKIVAMVHSLMPPDEGEVDTEMNESQIVQNETDALSVRVFPSNEGALTHVEVTTGDGSVLLMELTTEEVTMKPIFLIHIKFQDPFKKN